MGSMLPRSARRAMRSKSSQEPSISMPDTTRPPSLTSEYLAVAAVLTVTSALLVWATRGPSVSLAEPKDLLAPVFATVTLTALVWLVMTVVRNTSVMRGLASARYYEA